MMNPKVSWSNGKRVLRLVLVDEQGSRVQGLLWNRDIDLLDDALQVFKTYYIGGAAVQTVQPQFLYLSGGLTIQWVISRSNFIQPVVDRDRHIPYPRISMVPFAEFPSYVNSPNLVDLVAVVVEVHAPVNQDVGPKVLPKQELTVIHQEMKPFMLTLWNEFVSTHGVQLTALRNTLPIVVCRKLKASSYADISLGTTGLTFMAIDPEISQVAELRNWANNNIDAIRAVLNQVHNAEPTAIMLQNRQRNITPIMLIQADSDNAWVKASFTFAEIAQPFSYMVCPECGYRTAALYEEYFHCNSCKKNTKAAARCKLLVDLHDSSGSIRVVVFDKYAEKILGFSASEICKMKPEETLSMVISAENSFKDTQIYAEIKASRKKFCDGIVRFTMQRWFLDAALPDGEAAISEQSDTGLPPALALPAPVVAVEGQQMDKTSCHGASDVVIANKEGNPHVSLPNFKASNKDTTSDANSTSVDKEQTHSESGASASSFGDAAASPLKRLKIKSV